MSARTEVADLLRQLITDAELPWTVADSYRVPDGLTDPHLIVNTATLRPGAHLGLREVDLHVWVLSPLTDPDEADDQLDDALPVLLDLIDRQALVAWTEAERGLLADTYPAYRINLTTHTRKESPHG